VTAVATNRHQQQEEQQRLNRVRDLMFTAERMTKGEALLKLSFCGRSLAARLTLLIKGLFVTHATM